MIMCHNNVWKLDRNKKFKIEVRLHCIDIKDDKRKTTDIK